MASTGGLTRRRGGAGPGAAAGGSASPAAGGDDTGNDMSRGTSPTGRGGAETTYSGGENGHKIAFDPRDLNETQERLKQPKLTLMEEVLLMGLKDKQVGFFHFPTIK